MDVADERGVYEIRIDQFPRDDGALILTRRSLKLKNHAGQWALPGGSVDAGEEPEDTALRELAEEVGLELPRGNVIGRLDDFATRSRFVITPVVVWAGPGVDLTPNPAEVESILKEGLSIPKPVIMHFLVEREECVYPMVPAGKNITEMLLT